MAGGKRHHLDMEGKLWYKKSQYNTEEEVDHLRAYRLRVPLLTQPDRTLAFEQICPAYFKSSTSGKQQKQKKPQQQQKPERFQRQEKKTQRGRSITLKRTKREY